MHRGANRQKRMLEDCIINVSDISCIQKILYEPVVVSRKVFLSANHRSCSRHDDLLGFGPRSFAYVSKAAEPPSCHLIFRILNFNNKRATDEKRRDQDCAVNYDVCRSTARRVRGDYFGSGHVAKRRRWISERRDKRRQTDHSACLHDM
jgi:hypothetical protein